MNLNEHQTKYLSELRAGEAVINVARMRSSILAAIDAEIVKRSSKKQP
ncbi:MAG: hypothetical protein QXG05_02070 [Nitrososphaerota archaeon]